MLNTMNFASVVDVYYRIFGIKNEACAIHSCFTEKHKWISLDYGQWGKIVCDVFYGCYDISNIIRYILYITEVDCKLLSQE